ncbi:hypothetical protein [Sphingobium yanoikuyae]|uniref:hypothetical protein n=1 Tax=Sphingobium yanoikuyae TaxID=13690 RepID=UPI0026EEBEE3|nr:hypothetical protein [Sphingobium yanoikuyae]
MSEMIERVARAMQAEEERWRCITGGTGMQDVIVRDGDDGEPVEVSRHPQGDGDMWFWDTRNRAVAAAAIMAMRYNDADEAIAIKSGQAIGVDAVLAIEAHDAWIDAALVGEVG